MDSTDHPDYKQSTYRSNYQTHGWTVNNDLSRMFPQHMWTYSTIFMLIIPDIPADGVHI